MKKRSKLLIIAVAFALALTMIPMSGLAAYAETTDPDEPPEVSVAEFTVTAPICGTKIENYFYPTPKAPSDPLGVAGSIQREEPLTGVLPDVTTPDGANYVIQDLIWLVEDPNGYHGFSAIEEPTVVKGGNKYYFAVIAEAGTPVTDADGNGYLNRAFFADDATVSVTGAKLVWSQFYGDYQLEAPDAPEAADVPEEAVVEEPVEEEAAEEVVEEPVAEAEEPATPNDPEKVHTKGYTMLEAVFEVTVEHVPGAKVVENRVEPTATADGHYDEVIYCDKCHEELSRVTIHIPHTEPGDNNDNNNGVPKTADETGIFTWMLILALAAAACIRIKAGSRE